MSLGIFRRSDPMDEAPSPTTSAPRRIAYRLKRTATSVKITDGTMLRTKFGVPAAQ